MSMDPSAYAQSPPTPPPMPTPDPPVRSRWVRWLLAVTVAWAVLLGVLTWISVRDDPPTVREQRDLAHAASVAERATGALVVAASGPDGVVELGRIELEQGCRITPFLDGATLIRRINVYTNTDDGAGEAALRRIAERLPADYRAGARRTDEGFQLRADAGSFVAVYGELPRPGVLELSVETGCRPVPDGFELVTPEGPGGTVRMTLGQVLTILGRPVPEQPDWAAVPCPAGGFAGTASADSPGALAGAPSTMFRAPGERPVPTVDNLEAYAFRIGPLGVAITVTGDQTRVSVGFDCAR